MVKEKKEKKEKKDKKDKKDKKEKKSKRDLSDEPESGSEDESVKLTTRKGGNDDVVADKVQKKEAVTNSGASQPASNEKLQIFVSGLPYQTNEEQLRQFFDQGDAKLAQYITQVKLPCFQDTGKCRGFGHVKFSTREAFDGALKLNGKNLGARYLDIKPAAGTSTPNPAQVEQDSGALAESMPSKCKTLFVKNLPYSLGEDDIGDRFRPFGEIEEVRIARNYTTKESKGFGYISFKEHSCAKEALVKMNGKQLKGFEGRFLKVDFDVKQKAKQSYKTNLEDDGNKRYNKHVKRETMTKLIRKKNYNQHHRR